MNKYTIKKILFYISLLPYILLSFSCIYYAIIGYGYNLGKTAYGIIAIGNFLGDAFINIINLYFNPFSLFIIILWISYQIYYLLSLKSNKVVSFKSDKKDENNVRKKINLKKIFFFISVLCWSIYFASGLWAFFFGSKTGGRIIFIYNGIWN